MITLVDNTKYEKYREHDYLKDKSDKVIFEDMGGRISVADTDQGVGLREQVADLKNLLEAYRSGAVAENHKD